MHILFVHCSAVLLTDTLSIGVTRGVLCTAASSLFCSISALWLRALRSPMVHAGRDPHLSLLFSALLSDPCPTVVLVSNGLGHRSPRTHEKFGRFTYSGPT